MEGECGQHVAAWTVVDTVAFAACLYALPDPLVEGLDLRFEQLLGIS